MLGKPSGLDYFGGEPIDQWAGTKQRRLDLIAPEGRAFEERIQQEFSATDAEQIIKALDWMIALHASQEDRKEGKPYLDHTLAVAITVERDYAITDPDLVVAALLHDALEDQALHLAWDHLQTKYPEVASLTEDEIWQRCPNDIMLFALQRLELGFGKRAANIVGQLTNPDFDAMVANYAKCGNPITKNQLYLEHVRQMTKLPETFVVKMADFSANALQLGNLPDGDAKKEKLRKKYGPVIKNVLLPALRELPEDHPLFPQREQIIARLEEEYQREYKGKC